MQTLEFLSTEERGRARRGSCRSPQRRSLTKHVLLKDESRAYATGERLGSILGLDSRLEGIVRYCL